MRNAVVRRAAQIWQLEDHLSAVPTMERSRVLGDVYCYVRTGHDGQQPLQHRQYHSPLSRLDSGQKRDNDRRALYH